MHHTSIENARPLALCVVTPAQLQAYFPRSRSFANTLGGGKPPPPPRAVQFNVMCKNHPAIDSHTNMDSHVQQKNTRARFMYARAALLRARRQWFEGFSYYMCIHKLRRVCMDTRMESL